MQARVEVIGPAGATHELWTQPCSGPVPVPVAAGAVRPGGGWARATGTGAVPVAA
jgi:hypothetical protein